jgi:hypothetical protein
VIFYPALIPDNSSNKRGEEEKKFALPSFVPQIPQN